MRRWRRIWSSEDKCSVCSWYFLDCMLKLYIICLFDFVRNKNVLGDWYFSTLLDWERLNPSNYMNNDVVFWNWVLFSYFTGYLLLTYLSGIALSPNTARLDVSYFLDWVWKEEEGYWLCHNKRFAVFGKQREIMESSHKICHLICMVITIFKDKTERLKNAFIK